MGKRSSFRKGFVVARARLQLTFKDKRANDCLELSILVPQLSKFENTDPFMNGVFAKPERLGNVGN